MNILKDYTLPEYDQYRSWITMARKNNKSWDEIRYPYTGDLQGLQKFLDMQATMSFWNISTDDWLELVKRQESAELNAEKIKYDWQQGILKGPHQDNDCFVPTDSHSAWQLYKKRLLTDKGFRPEVVDNMEQTILKILKRLNSDTRNTVPVKGLVVGNVQSGKTANMAGLMAMAADWGWNMFIVLSGTIENLRIQTQSRIYGDLNNPGNLTWISLNHPSKKSDIGYRAQDMHFEEGSSTRHLTVCLKNSKRLKDLVQWMQADPNKAAQMRILIIDDEADQASINTLVDKNEQNAINKCITTLVNGLDLKGNKTKTPFMAMNYVGYTATPYANVLNESSLESLYPKDFITTLGLSKEYFGPQQIFGVEGGDYDGMDIIRVVSDIDLTRLDNIHNNIATVLPESMKDAICWFICGVAVMRYWGYEKPVSMLIHTSQRTAHHENVGKAIVDWFKNNTTEDILSRTEEVWDNETRRFSIDDFCAQYPDYVRKDSIKDYPSFDEIENTVRMLIEMEPSHISLTDEGERHYHEGLHLCIDNCKNNGDRDGMLLRLAYPEKNEMPCNAPAFIVIGGATLARGLTLEGLISTYFLRSVGQADTLMQMGRWFGYRKNYEMLPRIWMTDKTRRQFRFLSSLDQDLREEIFNMDVNNISPDQYGPKIKNTPSYSFIRIAAKNKMHGAVPGSADYTGSFNQTYLFDTNATVLQKNLDTTISFINDLGRPEDPDKLNPFAENDAIWRNVPFSDVRNFLEKYHFQRNLHFGQNLSAFLDWLQQTISAGKLSNWDIILSGGGIRNQNAANICALQNINVKKVHRSRKLLKGSKEPDNTLIDIGALRDPRDIVADVDLSDEDEELIQSLQNFKSGDAKTIRNKNGMDMVPQMIIYVVDKDSKTSSISRTDLNAPVDLAGLCVNIPGGKRGVGYASTVQIQLDNNNLFDDEGDLEDTDAD